MALQINFLTDNEHAVEFCKLYWQIDESDKFTNTVTQVAEQFGVKKNETAKTVAEFCCAYSTEYSCLGCGKPHTTPIDLIINKNSGVLIIKLCVKIALPKLQRRKKLKEEKNLPA